jgi:hypothetical protein
MPSWARRREIVVGRSDMERIAKSCHQQGSGRGRLLMGEVVPRCGIRSVIRIIVWERSVCGSEQKKDTMSLRFRSWLISFGEFMYGKMRCTYMKSCVAAEGEVLFGKMRHRQQRYGRAPVKMCYLHEATRLVGMWHAKMRQCGPVVRSDMWRCCCVQVWSVKCCR